MQRPYTALSGPEWRDLTNAANYLFRRTFTDRQSPIRTHRNTPFSPSPNICGTLPRSWATPNHCPKSAPPYSPCLTQNGSRESNCRIPGNPSIFINFVHALWRYICAPSSARYPPRQATTPQYCEHHPPLDATSAPPIPGPSRSTTDTSASGLSTCRHS